MYYKSSPYYYLEYGLESGKKASPACQNKSTDIYFQKNLSYLFNESEKASILNGTKSVYSYSKIVKDGNTNTFCGHMWYCSKDKAMDAIKKDYPNTVAGHIAQGTNFMCIFQSPVAAPADPTGTDERDDVYKLLDKINTNPLMTEADKSTLNKDVTNLLNAIKTEKIYVPEHAANIDKYRTYWSDYGPTPEHAFTYKCIEPELTYVTKTATDFVPAKPPTCTDSSAGTSYGAGGGGGFASTFIGAFGNGGAGAPGAVIIEW